VIYLYPSVRPKSWLEKWQGDAGVSGAHAVVGMGHGSPLTELSSPFAAGLSDSLSQRPGSAEKRRLLWEGERRTFVVQPWLLSLAGKLSGLRSSSPGRYSELRVNIKVGEVPYC
jgi:hypothetical protein